MVSLVSTCRHAAKRVARGIAGSCLRSDAFFGSDGERRLKVLHQTGEEALEGASITVGTGRWTASRHRGKNAGQASNSDFLSTWQ